MSEDDDTRETSGGWRMSSPWRRLSHSSYGHSRRPSILDDSALRWSLAMPAFAFLKGQDTATSGPENPEGTANLLEVEGWSRGVSNDSERTAVNTMPTSSLPPTRDGICRASQEEAFARLVRMKTSSSRTLKASSRMPSMLGLRGNDIQYGIDPKSRASSESLRNQAYRFTIAEPPTFSKDSGFEPAWPEETIVQQTAQSGTTTSKPVARLRVVDPSQLSDTMHSPPKHDNRVQWSHGKKWLSTTLVSLLAFCVLFSSSVTQSSSTKLAAAFEVSPRLMVLIQALFLLGVAVTPGLWVPLSCRCGRQLPLYLGLGGFIVFQIPCALADNLQTIFVCRWFAGAFGGSAVVISAQTLIDLWPKHERDMPLSALLFAMVGAPAVGSCAGAFIAEEPLLGWRWTAWFVFIVAGFLCFCCLILHSETSRDSNAILSARKRPQDALPGICATDCIPTLLDRCAWRPITMLVTEPMLSLIIIYVALATGVLFLLVATMSQTYIRRGWNDDFAGLPYISIVVGVGVGSMLNALYVCKRQLPRISKYGRLSPEERLLPLLLGGVTLSTGLLIYGWTAAPHISPVPGILAGVLLGVGFFLLGLCGLSYLLDVYCKIARIE